MTDTLNERYQTKSNVFNKMHSLLFLTKSTLFTELYLLSQELLVLVLSTLDIDSVRYLKVL